MQGVAVVPRERLSSWLRIEDPGRAAEALQRAGIPAEVTTDSSGVSGVRVQYTWVRAWLDYASSRGTRRAGGFGASWVELAPGFKRYEFSPGRDVSAEIGVDPASFLAEIAAASLVNEGESYATDVPEELILDRIEAWADKTRTYADANDRQAETLFLERDVPAQWDLHKNKIARYCLKEMMLSFRTTRTDRHERCGDKVVSADPVKKSAFVYADLEMRPGNVLSGSRNIMSKCISIGPSLGLPRGGWTDLLS